MRILELTLSGFRPILSGTGKESIHINLRDSKELITVLIGKIGSGKTYILSHLQPFSTVGGLDVRNQDDPIIPEQNGKKIIVYEKDNHEYVITHDYIWTGKTHSKKSYIEKDGVELNENGNSSSFKEIIQMEFGIDQSILRLIRLGPNVVNFINMKATERKSYIANLLSSTEMYLTLYKYWSADLRNLNTKVSVLMNKLNSFNEPVTDIKDKIDALQDDIFEINELIANKTFTKYELQADNKSYLGNQSYGDMMAEFERLQRLIPSLKENINSLEDLLDSFKSFPDIGEVSKEIGRLDQKISSTEELLDSLHSKHESIERELHVLKDKRSMISNERHLNILKETYQEILNESAKLKSEVQFFNCKYTATFLEGFIGDLNTVNILINEISQYDSDMVKILIQSDSSVIQFAKKKIEILEYRKIKVHALITNLKFSESYQAPSPLYFPPFCPTSNCPYYKTHPITIKKQNKTKSEVEQQLAAYQNELRDLDIEIYKYTDYPIVFSKIQTLKMMWKKATDILSNINALRVESLLQVLTSINCQVWYSYDRIVDTIDLIKKRDKYFELSDKMKIIKNEINELSINDVSEINIRISQLENEKDGLEHQVELEEINLSNTKSSLKEFNQLYVDLSEKSIYEEKLIKEKNTLTSVEERINTIQLNDDKIKINNQHIQSIQTQIIELTAKLNQKCSKLESLKAMYNDIKYTNAELESTLQEQRYMTYMVDAVSSKKGIPLIMVQMFLDSCREIVNSLIYDVIEDEVEILPFQIDETEFKIPYMVNGQYIDDISKASQGQTSIVSTAMSFALLQQSGAIEYSIPLLDEVDGPLHKSDKQRFISILLKHLQEIKSEQCFVITHDDNTFDGYPVQVIMTTDEVINEEKYSTIIRI